jgi:transcription elongation GreA/GreB family factor
MNPQRRNTSAEDQELLALEEALAALTIRVAALRRRRTAAQTPPQTPQQPIFTIGDRVYFQLNGNRTEGVIIERTLRRFRIRDINTGHVYLRSGNTITLIV